MTDSEFEAQLRKLSWPQPPPGLEAVLLARAAARLTARRRRGRLRWPALGVVAVLLLAVNLGSEAVHTRRMMALVGAPSHGAEPSAAAIAAWWEQTQLLAQELDMDSMSGAARGPGVVPPAPRPPGGVGEAPEAYPSSKGKGRSLRYVC